MAGGKARPWVTSASYEAAIRYLVSVRTSAGLSQRDLAARIGKPRSFVSKVENRERRLDIVEFLAISDGLGIKPDELLAAVSVAVGRPLEF